MTKPDPYATPKGVEDAIKAAARAARAADPSLSIEERIRLEYFNRFLSRIFSENSASEWVLKGGTCMLARVPSARATLDIDLYRQGYDLDEAVSDLRRLAECDLNDHFRFVYIGHDVILEGDAQPYADGYRVEFEVYIGAQKRGRINVDLSIGAGLTCEPTVSEPVNALDLPRLTSFPYHLYPVVDQIADKVCATLTRYGDRPSSREKDLIDIVVLARTQDIDGRSLINAIGSELARRKMPPAEQFVIPRTWGPVYEKLAKGTPSCEGVTDIDAAQRLAAVLVDPALDGTAAGRRWSAEVCTWLDGRA